MGSTRSFANSCFLLAGDEICNADKVCCGRDRRMFTQF
jgi:hypothetical protein